jgi:chromosome segregation ATPase
MSGCHNPNCIDLLDKFNQLAIKVSALGNSYVDNVNGLLDRVKELERWPSLIQHLDRAKSDLQEQINRLEQSREAHSRSNSDLFIRLEKVEKWINSHEAYPAPGWDSSLNISLDKEQASFFDRIYPSLSRRLDDLEKADTHKTHQILELILERRELMKTIDQYKRKIQRVEQFLIENGLIKLLTKGDTQ